MRQPYTYSWYIQRFKTARKRAEAFIHSLDEHAFLLRPGTDTWGVAECYSHLIKFGEIYYRTIQSGLDSVAKTVDHPGRAFTPRWPWKIVISFFEPPYKIKVKTVKPFKPETTSNLGRDETLEEFAGLQDRFVAQLEQAEQQRVDLGGIKVENPILSFLKMTLSECYAVAEAHQRRHLWQAQQVVERLYR